MCFAKCWADPPSVQHHLQLPRSGLYHMCTICLPDTPRSNQGSAIHFTCKSSSLMAVGSYGGCSYIDSPFRMFLWCAQLYLVHDVRDDLLLVIDCSESAPLVHPFFFSCSLAHCCIPHTQCLCCGFSIRACIFFHVSDPLPSPTADLSRHHAVLRDLIACLMVSYHHHGFVISDPSRSAPDFGRPPPLEIQGCLSFFQYDLAHHLSF